MKHSHFKPLALAVLVLACAAAAQADSGGARVPVLPKYQQECAACHIAYPPGMLPPAAWRHLMGSLQQHYGTDASLDEVSLREISGWLQVHAGTYKRVSEAPPQDRITKSAWFLRKHNAREVSPEVWVRPAVGSAANCVACHAQADQGRFDERDIRIPR